MAADKPRPLLQNSLLKYNAAKKWGKKCSTGEKFICTEANSYKCLQGGHLPMYTDRSAVKSISVNEIIPNYYFNI